MTINPAAKQLPKKRAIRRHQRQRIISRRYERVARGAWFVKSSGRLGKTNTVCSCWMCGNPRKYFGLVTRQETLVDEALAEVNAGARIMFEGRFPISSPERSERSA